MSEHLSARVAALRRRLLSWFGAARRELPWRSAPGRLDPYRVWISEAMLQQTQVATVIPYYRRFLKRFPTLRSLATAEEEDVLAAWSGLGYYARARALSRAAREAIARFGALPRTVEELRELPGFGPYTAGAVASIAFGLPVPAVDGNAARVLSRIFLVGDSPQRAAFRDRVWGHAAALVEGAGEPGSLNQAIMELGALVCRPAPRCDDCPVEPLCAAKGAGRERAVPSPRRRPPRRVMRLAVGLCVSNGRVLLVRRPAKGLFAGLWAPPFVEVAAEDEAASAISEAIEREPSMETGEFVPVGSLVRELTHRQLHMTILSAPVRRMAREREGLRLVQPFDLGDLAVPTAMRAALSLGEALPPISRRAGTRRTASPKAARAGAGGGGVGRRIERV